MLSIDSTARAADEVSHATRIERLLASRETPVATEWTAVPKVVLGFLGNNAGEIRTRLTVVRTITEEARGLEVRIATASSDNDRPVAFVDEDELAVVIASMTDFLKPAQANRSPQQAQERFFTTRGGFRITASARGGEDVVYRFAIFVPVNLLAVSRDFCPSVGASLSGTIECRMDGSGGVLAPVFVKGNRAEAQKVLAMLTSAAETLRSLSARGTP